MQSRYGYEEEPASQIDLTPYDDEYTHSEEPDFEPIPDGTYQVEVHRVELTKSKTSGHPMLKWTLRILAPRHQGRLLWHNTVIVSGKNIWWIKKDLQTCGLVLARLSELPRRLDELLDIKLEVTKRTKGDYENVYFNNMIAEADPQWANTEDLDEEMEHDAPF